MFLIWKYTIQYNSSASHSGMLHKSWQYNYETSYNLSHAKLFFKLRMGKNFGADWELLAISFSQHSDLQPPVFVQDFSMNKTFPWNKKLLQLCLKNYIFCFLAKVIFNRSVENFRNCYFASKNGPFPPFSAQWVFLENPKQSL